MPTPAEIAAENVVRMKACNPLFHRRRFEIQLHTGGNRKNIYLPTWDLVVGALKSVVKTDDPRRPDFVLVCDNRDTYSRVLRLEKTWCGYSTTLRRGAAVGEVPRGWEDFPQAA